MKGYLAVVVAALAAMPVVSRAQGAPEAPKQAPQLAVAVIEVQRLVEESAVGKEIKAKLEKAQADKAAQFKKMNDDLDTLKKQLDAQRSTLTDAKVAELQKQIDDRQVAVQRFQEDAQQQLDEMKRKELANLETQLMPIIKELGQEKKLLLIFNKYQSGLVYADDSVDITDEVLRRFNTHVVTKP